MFLQISARKYYKNLKMETKIDFIINSIIKISKIDRIEGIENGGTIITMSGTKKGFLKNEEIKITIERSQIDIKNDALVTAIINGQKIYENINKDILFDVFDKSKMLDDKLQMKLDMLFNPSNNESLHIGIKATELMTSQLVSVYKNHLHECWSDIEDEIKIEVVKGSNGKKIVFRKDIQWGDERWLSFFFNGILLDAALNNCDMLGVESIVFIDEFIYKDFDEIVNITYTIEDLRRMK